MVVVVVPNEVTVLGARISNVRMVKLHYDHGEGEYRVHHVARLLSRFFVAFFTRNGQQR